VEPILLRPGEGEIITDRAERTVRIIVSQPLLDMTWTRFEAGERGPDPHVHHEHTDSFYIVEGEIEFGLGPDGAELVRAPAGTVVAIPPNVVHTFGNESNARAVYLNFHAPSTGFADSLRARRDGRTEDASRWDSFDPPADGGLPATNAIVCRAGEGERLERQAGTTTILAELTEISFFELVLENGWPGIEAHAHDDHLDSFFVLAGEVDFVHSGRAQAGTLMAALPQVEHGIQSASGGTRLLNVHAPDAGFAESIRQR